MPPGCFLLDGCDSLERMARRIYEKGREKNKGKGQNLSVLTHKPSLGWIGAGADFSSFIACALVHAPLGEEEGWG